MSAICPQHSGIEARVGHAEETIRGHEGRILKLEWKQWLIWGGVLVIGGLAAFFGGRMGVTVSLPSEVRDALRGQCVGVVQEGPPEEGHGFALFPPAAASPAPRREAGQ